MPSFQKLYDNYESKVVFLFVANDEPKKVENFIKDKSYDLPVYFQGSNSPSAIDSNALPTTFVIDSKGLISCVIHKVILCKETALFSSLNIKNDYC